MPRVKAEEGELSLKMRMRMRPCEKAVELGKTRNWTMRLWLWKLNDPNPNPLRYDWLEPFWLRK
jgi:hypothetical protein